MPKADIKAGGALSGRDLVLSYGEKIIVDGLSLNIPRGSFCSVIGPNGCGKSTLLKALSRTLPIKRGQVRVLGRNIGDYAPRELSRQLAFLAQSPRIPEQFTVRELVSYGRFPHTGWSGSLGREDYERIHWAMEETEITAYADRELVHLSGGERQRVWIAMALAQEADVLLLDEPTTYLDINHQFQTLELISRLNRERNRTILMVLHDLNQAARYSDHLFVMKEGSLVAEGRPDQVMKADLLRDVFHIDSRIIRDDENDCPYFIPLRGLS